MDTFYLIGKCKGVIRKNGFFFVNLKSVILWVSVGFYGKAGRKQWKNIDRIKEKDYNGNNYNEKTMTVRKNRSGGLLS